MEPTEEDSFVNIDLDASLIVDKQSSDLHDESVEEEEKLEEKETTLDKSVINAQLNDVVDKTFVDLSQFFKITPTSQINELNDSIDSLLTHMEEFCGLLEQIRAGNTDCLDSILETLEPKLQQCNVLFDMVDKLERIVGRVGFELDRMEDHVNNAENLMGSRNSIRKIFSFITNSASQSLQSRNSTSTPYTPPDVYKTHELMQL